MREAPQYGHGRLLERSHRLQAMVRKKIAALDPAGFHPSIRTGLTGNVVTNAEQYRVVNDDLTHVGIAGVAMILRGDFLFFLRVRAVLTMTLTIGVGVDYAINLVHWRRIQGSGHVPMIVRETGGAVILCVLTTILGHLALMQTVNPAMRSFGLAAVVGEMTCLSAVIIVLPAVLMLIESRSQSVSERRALSTASIEMDGK